MGANLRRLSADWQAQFGHPLELAETFVDPTQFVGTMYRAGNWIPVGRTRGFARSNGYTEPHGRLKEMYLYPLRGDARARLRAPEPCLAAPAPTGGSCRCPVTLVAARVRAYPRSSPRPASSDSRSCSPSGSWRGCYHGVDATWRYACHLTQDELLTLGAWRDKRTGDYHPPSRATLHRAMTDTDPDAFQAATDRWLAARCPTTTALAADGKRLRGANRQRRRQTVSLVSHHDKQPVATACLPKRAVRSRPSTRSWRRPTSAVR